jgi:hypothetical protein
MIKKRRVTYLSHSRHSFAALIFHFNKVNECKKGWHQVQMNLAAREPEGRRTILKNDKKTRGK